jgi:cytochrome c oxidase subunit 3
MTRSTRLAGDVGHLPSYNFGSTSLGWWAVIGFMLIEGMGFVLVVGAYFYLTPFERSWPPDTLPPSLRWGTLFTVLVLLSELPNIMLSRAAQRMDLRAVRTHLTLMAALGLVLLTLRALEFTTLNVRWESNAYGSILWAIVILHTTHVITDVFETGVLTALVWSKPMDGRKFSDVSDNAMYWHFIVWSWVLLYGVIYWTPRWL